MTSLYDDEKDISGSYRFGADFYQPDATLQLTMQDGDLTLHWTDGSTTVLIPTAKDQFIDRAYWAGASIHRDATGQVDALVYDHFTGTRVTGP